MREQIVSLILEHKGKILAEKRKLSKPTSPGDIIFPAGHVDEGETKEQALFREIEEELGIRIHNPQLIHEADFDCEEKQRIFFYKCEKWEGEIKSKEAEELLWVDPSEFHILTYQISRDALSKYFESKKESN